MSGRNPAQPGKVGGNDGGDFRVAADGLAIGQQDDRLTIAGHLNTSRRDAVRDDVFGFRCDVFEQRAFEPDSHTVELGGGPVFGIEQGKERFRAKVPVLRAGQEANGRVGIVPGRGMIFAAGMTRSLTGESLPPAQCFAVDTPDLCPLIG